jgi:hypothetical protein
MFWRFCLFLAALGLIAVPNSVCPAAEDTATRPALLVKVKSLDDLVADVQYLVGLAGREEEARQVEGMFKSVVGPKGLEGIDTKRPLGLYGFFDPNLTDSTAVLMIPIAEEKAFLSLLGGLNVNPTKEEDGAYVIAPGIAPLPIYFRFAHKYVYATIRDKAGIAKDNLLEPSKVFGTNPVDTASLLFRVDQIPDVFKQILVSQSEQRLADLEEQKQPNESAAQRAFRAQSAKEVAKQLTSVVNEGGEVGLRFNIDRKANQLSVELTLSGKPKSVLASNIASISASKSIFAGLSRSDAALNAIVHGVVPEGLHRTFTKAVEDGFRQSQEKETDKNKRMQHELIYKALSPTIQAGELDAAVSLRGPSAGKQYALVAGLKLKDGKAVEDAFRDLVKDVPRADRDKVQLDAETAKGVKIHRLLVQQAFDANTRRIFGDNPVYVAFRGDAVLLALGEGGLSAIQEAIAAQPAMAQPFQIDLSMTRVAPLIKNDKADASAIAKDVFSGDQTNKDRARFSIEGGDALKIRAAVDGAVVKFLSLMEKETKKPEE